MSYLKTKGIVIREVKTGESDKIITVFSKNEGKINCHAKAARRTKSSLIAGTQLLCYSDLVLFKGKEMYSLNSCDVIESFYQIRNDVIKLTYAAHLIDIINDAVQEGQPSSRLLRLFLNTLHMLAYREKSPELLIRIFEIRLLSILGYTPYVDGCMNCGSRESNRYFFNFDKCGLICPECLKGDPFPMELSAGVAKAVYYIIHARLEELFSFELSPAALEELGRLSSRYLRERLERNYTKLEFLKELKL